MSKFEIPKFRYLWQDLYGAVFVSTHTPRINCRGVPTGWIGGMTYHCLVPGDEVENPNWQNTLIDLETDDYTFENGILSRVEK